MIEKKDQFNNYKQTSLGGCILPGTNPKALDRPQEEVLDDYPTPLGNQGDTEMREAEVHRDFAVGIHVVDHNHTGHPAKKGRNDAFITNNKLPSS